LAGQTLSRRMILNDGERRSLKSLPPAFKLP
jgi:hypothetical protein